MLFDVYFAEEETEFPTEGTYYVVAGNGFFIHRDNGIIRGLVKVDKASFLREIAETALWNPPPVPAKLIAQSLLFFRTVYKKYHDESAIMLHYNPTTKQYALVCPEQTVGPGSVEYDSSDRIDNDYLLVGSIHSHCGFGAFHSGVDRSDEETFDGLHITIGHVDRKHFTFVASLVVNGRRFPYFDLEEVAEGVVRVDWSPSSFMSPLIPSAVPEGQPIQSRVNRPAMFNGGETYGSWNGLLGELEERRIESMPEPIPIPVTPAKYRYQKRENYYDLIMLDGSEYGEIGFPIKWMDKVSKRTFFAATTTSAGPLFSGMKSIFVSNDNQDDDPKDANAPVEEGDKANEQKEA